VIEDFSLLRRTKNSCRLPMKCGGLGLNIGLNPRDSLLMKFEFFEGKTSYLPFLII
jgi:hypothetical protein